MPTTDVATAFSALITYERKIVPLVRAELRRWEARAATIPDPLLRAAALSALRDKAQNAEATAIFGILAPRAARVAALRATVALQVAIDYLDSLGEEPSDDPLANGLRLHGALCDAVSPGSRSGDWYGLHPQHEDGGYLGELVTMCQEGVAELPAKAAVLARLGKAAKRCGEGQSHTHAAARSGGPELEAWARSQESSPGYLWWELAAGASSSVAAHALIAVAADPRATTEEAALVDAAYFPPIGALTVLLDDLVDRDEDLANGQHNYLAYSGSAEAAANRIGMLARRARAMTRPLRRARRHRAILAGVAALYLTAAPGTDEYAQPIRERLLETDPTVRPLMLALRLRRDA
jgi:tetraprenyl-beta-curcumene synthase